MDHHHGNRRYTYRITCHCDNRCSGCRNAVNLNGDFAGVFFQHIVDLICRKAITAQGIDPNNDITVMRKTVLSLFFFAALLAGAAPQAFAQEPQEPDVNQIIDTQLENLTRLLNLDDVQLFFVDSILQYNYPAMMDEVTRTRKTGASNSETYQVISDKWMAATDEALEKILSEEQWKRYMKSSYGKEKKRRDKRISERNPQNP